MRLTLRNRNIITGLVATTLLFSLVVLGVKASFGEFDDIYRLRASFDSAGQGLQRGSDVKIRGINVGTVESVKLKDGRALVTMDIKRSERIPSSSAAVVRPKTLFGEKFIDVVPCPDPKDPQKTSAETGTCADENSGPYYPTNGTAEFPAERTVGGFELERVLTDAYPLLRDIKPSELMTVLDTLGAASRNMGPAINRQLVNGKKVLDVFDAHDADTRVFLQSLAQLSSELGLRGNDIVALARQLNVALPTINARGARLTQLLQQTARLSGDVADLLENNKAFFDESLGPGDEVIQTLYDHRNDLVPLVVGLRHYAQFLVEVSRIPLTDGTIMAAVKGLTGGDACTVPIFDCTAATAAPSVSGAGKGPTGTGAPAGGLLGGVTGIADPGVRALLGFIDGLGTGS